MKEKLILSINKDDIASLKIEEGQEYTGFGSSMMRLVGTNKLPNTFLITAKDGNEYRFVIGDYSGTNERDDDNSTFQDLVINMGMFLS